MRNPSPPPPVLDREGVERVIAPIVRAHGAELVGIELKPERGWVLRVFIEKAGAAEQRLSTRDASVTLELCASVSRDISPALDVADLIPHAYHLEVGSPGVERTLHREQDFTRFAGQKAKLRLREPKDGQRVLVGVLGGIEGGNVRITTGKQAYDVSLSSVESARLVFEFGSSGKPSHKKH
jgi:ribosome maturation factor RimP